jgi:hypothetical protein
MNVISWNLAGRLQRIPQQIEMLASREPDLVALQEVKQQGLPRLRSLLANSGLIHQVDNFALAPCPALLTGPRCYGLLIASRFSIVPWEPNRSTRLGPSAFSLGISRRHGACWKCILRTFQPA